MGIEKMPNFYSASAIEQKQAERLANTKKVFDGFINLKSDERVLFILDDKPFNTDQDFINLFRKELDGRGIKYDEFLADDKKTKQNELFNAIKGFNMIFFKCFLILASEGI